MSGDSRLSLRGLQLTTQIQRHFGFNLKYYDCMEQNMNL
ncbi:DUF2492 family protein [Vibrio vulnificus]|nr:DUF2492 family protein [Vibrio vulnificus]EJO9873980.1 DUF2492 family protein [Vibrio vulnificus]ELK8309861.1 DUF2492 family protein [Vibrio vulnificus]ELS0760170.1 DUF2492 family protein [Vibrio vulnificus]HAS8515207.1 DUF2492 family protein [Vibrio vulnificus]